MESGAPGDPAVRSPGPVEDLILTPASTGAATLSWTAAPHADRHAASRGSLSGIGPGQYGACLSPDVTGTSLDDADLPAHGDAFFYLVVGVSDACGVGTLGFDAGGAERINLDPDRCL